MKKNFRSKYSESPTNISAAQHLTELICENKAKKENKELVVKFWKLPHWEKFFKQQIIAANSLLRIYDVRDVASAIRNNPYILSLFSKYLDSLIKIEASKPKPVEAESLPQPTKTERPDFKKKNNLDKLMEL